MEKLKFEEQMLKDLLEDTNIQILVSSNNLGLLKLRACIYNLLFYYDDALADLQQINKIESNDAAIHYLMSDCHYQLQNYHLAKRECLHANLIQAGKPHDLSELEYIEAPTAEELRDLHEIITFEFNNTVAELFQRA